MLSLKEAGSMRQTLDSKVTGAILKLEKGEGEGEGEGGGEGKAEEIGQSRTSPILMIVRRRGAQLWQLWRVHVLGKPFT